jgi:hypothetical protein
LLALRERRSNILDQSPIQRFFVFIIVFIIRVRGVPVWQRFALRKMVAGVKQLPKDRQSDVIAIGYPGRVVGERAVTEPP